MISALPHNIDFELHQKNLQKIKEIIGNNKNPVVLLAFGNPINAATYLKDCLKEIVDLLQPLNPKWKQIGEPTKLGIINYLEHLEKVPLQKLKVNKIFSIIFI